MRIRRVAVFIDGGFYLKRLPHVTEKSARSSPAKVAETAQALCRRHVQRLIGESEDVRGSRWLDHLYRVFYYDVRPYEGAKVHPLTNKWIAFRQTREAKFRKDLFAELRRKRKFALRLGEVREIAAKGGAWRLDWTIAKRILETRKWIDVLEAPLNGKALPQLDESRAEALRKLVDAWRSLGENHLSFGLQQKGVDMRLGIDIVSIVLKRQADTLVLVTGDSDFVPAAKVARREGAEVILDSLGQRVSEDLQEHVDAIESLL